MFQGSVHKTQRELDEMRQLIDLGKLPKDAIEQYWLNQELAVFGEGFKRDAQGRPLEQGKGSAAQPTAQSLEAYKKYGKAEPNYQETVQRMEAALAAHNAKRDKQQPYHPGR
jgi:hypothetical protein